MKKSIAYSAVLFFAIVVLLSCSKSSKDSFTQSTPANPDRIINAKVVPGQTYAVSIANSGDVSIGRQATHYLVSETAIDEKNGSIIYRYLPASGFKGVDEVLLTHRTEISGSSNNGCNYGSDYISSHATLIAVKITVAD